jgi:hypothetical protein
VRSITDTERIVAGSRRLKKEEPHPEGFALMVGTD